MAKDANAGSKDDTELKTSLPLQVMQDMGGADIAPVTIDKGDGVQMSVYGSFFSAINDKKVNLLLILLYRICQPNLVCRIQLKMLEI